MELNGKMLWPESTKYMVGGEIVRTELYLASSCELPTSGAVFEAPVQLTRETWYEVYALCKAKQPNVADGVLPGVSFRTSRWGGAREMMNALHFPQGIPGSPNGGVAIDPTAPLVPGIVTDNDAAFDAFLEALGMDSWPVATQPRVSLLWREDGVGWRCAGVLIESAEPIHRPGRFEIRALKLRMGAPGAGVSFDIMRRDRSGSRILFATSSPFIPQWVPGGPFIVLVPPQLVLEGTDLPYGAPPKVISGALQLPIVPSFAEQVA